MPVTWSLEAEESLFETLKYYEIEVGQDFSESIENRIYSQVDKLEGFEKSIPVSDIYPTTQDTILRIFMLSFKISKPAFPLQMRRC